MQNQTITPAQIAEAIGTLLAQTASAPTTPVVVPASTKVEVPLDLLTEVAAARAAEAVVKAAKEASEDRLKAFMGEATEATYNGTVVVSFAPGERTTLDTAALKAEQPDVAAKYQRTSPVRPLLFKNKVLATLFGAA